VRTFQLMQDNALYVHDYFEFLALKPRLYQPVEPVRLQGEGAPRIEFRDVSFRYIHTKAWALRHISLVIEPGQNIAIIGENGAGKTTFVKLLMRLYDPTEGQILVNGIDLREIDSNDWSARIGILFQDFNRYGPLSLKENVQTGKITRPVADKNIRSAISQAGGKALTGELPNGLEQILTNSFSEGVDLSGGQWQRVALARAFYREAPILILDEPTSAIDAKGEFEIFQEIARTKADKTMVIISHRFSTVRNADDIVVLEHGQVSERGSHHELMALRGQYHDLFELQAAGYR
jgi:ATP-binding cassette subfamily B protein